MQRDNESRFIVLKFGGTSVSGLKHWETIAAILRRRIEDGLRPIVVCSALSGISNELEKLLKKIVDGDYRPVLEDIVRRHRSHGVDLGVDADEILSEEFTALERLARGASLIGEVSERLHAKIMAFGELMSTRLGAAYLNRIGILTQWEDVRHWLVAEDRLNATAGMKYLCSSCIFDPDKRLQAYLKAKEAQVFLTQGFIAGSAGGETVLLGRGGSDTSASYLAAKLEAERCEIWTDVPGMFTANPKLIPTARLLRSLDYGEAQEITSTGAKVLHPRCINPVRLHEIPLHIYSTEHPDLDGTVISADAAESYSHMKAVSTKQGIMLISMETLGMWQQVGFLADVFACFKRHGLSIDLVSTSETNVTASLDAAANALDRCTLNKLIDELSDFCAAKIIGPCSSVSLVGRNIRTIIHKLGSTLEVFEEKKIYLISQAASDLNLTFVVEEDQAERLARQLHTLIFQHRKRDNLLGTTWKKLFEKPMQDRQAVSTSWWKTKREELLASAKGRTPLYIYDKSTLDGAVDRLKSLDAIERIFYAIKANSNPEILRRLYDAGLGFELVSEGELEHVCRLFPEIDPRRLLFTPNFAARHEYEKAFEKGCHVTLDNLHPLKHWPDLFRGKRILLRIDPGKGRGHHEYVHTAGKLSKFGISPEQFDELVELVRKAKVHVVGLHAHTGSGVLTHDAWQKTAIKLIEVAERFDGVKVLDLGGGLGVVEKPGQSSLDMAALNESLKEVRDAHPEFELWLEPGRYPVSEAGVLITRVNQMKQKGEFNYIGVDAGFNTLIRPALYGAYHEIVNLSRLGEPAVMTVNIVGPICESGDTLGYNREMPKTAEGDLLLIATAGAYGRAMSSNYNLRPPAEEEMI